MGARAMLQSFGNLFLVRLVIYYLSMGIRRDARQSPINSEDNAT